MKEFKYRKNNGFLLLILVLLGSVSSDSFAEDPKMPASKVGTSSTVKPILEVGGTPITHRDLYNAMLRRYGYEELNAMTEDLVIEKEAAIRRVKVSDKDVDKELEDIKNQFNSEQDFNSFMKRKRYTLEQLKRQLRIKLLKEKLVTKDEKIKVSSDEVEKFFEENKARFSTPERIKLSHILVETKKEADEIVSILSAGADFGKLAAIKSVDEETGKQNGAIGVYRRGVLNPSLEKVLFSLKAGQISDPVNSALGWHVFKIEAKSESKEAKLDKELKEKIEKLLLSRKIEQAYPEWIKKASKRWVKK